MVWNWQIHLPKSKICDFEIRWYWDSFPMEAVHCPNKDFGRPNSLHDEMSRLLCIATKGNESWHQRDRQFEGAGVPLHHFNSEIPNSWLGRLKVHARRMSRAVSQSDLIKGDPGAFGEHTANRVTSGKHRAQRSIYRCCGCPKHPQRFRLGNALA